MSTSFCYTPSTFPLSGLAHFGSIAYKFFTEYTKEDRKIGAVARKNIKLLHVVYIRIEIELPSWNRIERTSRNEMEASAARESRLNQHVPIGWHRGNLCTSSHRRREIVFRRWIESSFLCEYGIRETRKRTMDVTWDTMQDIGTARVKLEHIRGGGKERESREREERNEDGSCSAKNFPFRGTRTRAEEL